MKVVGIIAEYNPFHAGHAYQIAQAKKMTGADYALIVMSGNFVQRGLPAIFDKQFRTRCALYGGADCVIELPSCYATASGPYFALGAVSLLDALGVCDAICFGSESGSIDGLTALADLLTDEPESYRKQLRTFLASGMSFPLSRRNAVSELYGESLAEILDYPNNLLAVEYLIAMKKIGTSIVPCTIARIGDDYHSEDLHECVSSATALRAEWTQNGCSEAFLRALPETVRSCYQKLLYSAKPDDMTAQVFYRLMQLQTQSSGQATLTDYLDVSPELANRITDHCAQCYSFEHLTETLHTKELTHTRVNRSLLHILLDIKKKDMEQYLADGTVYYARLLGFRKDAAPLLSAIKKKARIPLLSKYADAGQLLKDSKNGKTMLLQNDFADNIYRSLVMQRYQCVLPAEAARPIEIIDF